MAADLEASLKAETSWARAVVFGADGAVIASTFDVNKAELTPYLTAFDDKDKCIGMGFELAEEHFDVHRFYGDEGVAFGRRGDADSGEGIALHRVKGSSGNIFAIITYTFPNLASLAVAKLQEFGKSHLTKL